MRSPTQPKTARNRAPERPHSSEDGPAADARPIAKDDADAARPVITDWASL